MRTASSTTAATARRPTRSNRVANTFSVDSKTFWDWQSAFEHARDAYRRPKRPRAPGDGPH